MKKVFLCISILMVSCILCGCSKKTVETIPTIDTSTMSGKTFKDQVLDDLKITNFSIAVENDESFISFGATNISEVSTTIDSIKIYLYDKDDDLVLETYGLIGTLSPGQTKTVYIESDINLSIIKRVSYEKM